MRKAKNVLMAVVVAGSALLVGATPRPAAAEVTVAATALATMVPDGTYPVLDENGRQIGTITIRDGRVVSGSPT
jgi:hypothetical protein